LKIKAIKVKTLLLGLGCLIIIFTLIGILALRLEGSRPALNLDSEPLAIGESYQFSITASDIKSGLRKVWIGLLKDGKEFALLEKEYSGTGFLKRRKVLKESFNVLIEPKKLGISDGQALLRIAVWDYSWRRWFRGNNVYLEKEVMLDPKPPVIEVLSRAHNLSQGGAGLVIYRVSEPCPLNGVYIGENFFPGKPGYFNDKNVYMTFIALNYKQGSGTRIFLQAKDWAGNSARKGFPHYFRKKKFRNDTINITDNFLNWKMAEFKVDGLETSGNRPVDKFLTINRILRKKSYEQIVAQIGQTDSVIRWQGAFIRLPGSARKAGFADRRIYKYKGRIIDRQTHQGIDLASLEQTPVPASNQGRVAFAGENGIYGQTILLDHGFGLFSMYSHLSQMDVQMGQIVKKGEPIGRTGMTGLAGGDHLHFGMLVHHVFVNPIEWWDSSWITNNIVDKIRSVKSRLDEG
jgi:murein DD-endopeptidase MepM/ murein hydrolase activator NlpD